jgi:hypothetical protein
MMKVKGIKAKYPLKQAIKTQSESKDTALIFL